ncbi:hypothetical protein VCCP104417_3588, partial [Vibrio cholerae CP1044(17)]
MSWLSSASSEVKKA